jgi:hypothetical protein
MIDARWLEVDPTPSTRVRTPSFHEFSLAVVSSLDFVASHCQFQHTTYNNILFTSFLLCFPSSRGRQFTQRCCDMDAALKLASSLSPC